MSGNKFADRIAKISKILQKNLPSLCDYGDAYILVKDIITVPNASAGEVNAKNAYKKVIYQKCAGLLIAWTK